MGVNNKKVREELEEVYGSRCMICEGIRKIKPPMPKKGRYKGKSIERQLTYHHIKPRSEGGECSVENGAVLCRRCHNWLEELPRGVREAVNRELEEYKECKVVFVDDLETDYEVKVMDFYVGPERKYDRAKKKKEDAEIIRDYERNE